MLLNRNDPFNVSLRPWLLFPGASIHKVKDGLENLFEMMIKPSLVISTRVFVSVCVCLCLLTSEMAGWIVGACRTFCSSSTTRGTPSIPRRLTSNSNSHVSLTPRYFAVALRERCQTLAWWHQLLISLEGFFSMPKRRSMCVFTCTCFVCEVSEMEESMLSALRPPEHTAVPARYTSASTSAAHARLPTDPSELPPDRLHVEMEMSPDSQIILYGPLLRALISIKVPESLTLYSREFTLTVKMNDYFDEWSWRC